MNNGVIEQMVLNHDTTIKDNTKRIENLEKSSAVIENKLDTTNQLLKYIVVTLIGGIAVPIILSVIIK